MLIYYAGNQPKKTLEHTYKFPAVVAREILADIGSHCLNKKKEVLKLQTQDSTKSLPKKVFYLGLGVLTFTRKKAKKVVDEFVKKGELEQEEAEKMVDDLVIEGKKEKESLEKTINSEVAKVVGKTGFATKDDIKKLADKIDRLEKKIATKTTAS